MFCLVGFVCFLVGLGGLVGGWFGWCFGLSEFSLVCCVVWFVLGGCLFVGGFVWI